MAIRGTAYAINGVGVTSPDEEVWTPMQIGQDLTGIQRRSPYWLLEWRQTVAGSCNLEWFDHDNSELESLTTRTPGHLDEIETYTDVICQRVMFRQRRGVGNEVVATFLVNIGQT